METNQKEIPLFIFVIAVIGSVALLGLILNLSERNSHKPVMTQETLETQPTSAEKRTYKMIGSPVIVLTTLSPDQANCLKGGGGLSCFTK